MTAKPRVRLAVSERGRKRLANKRAWRSIQRKPKTLARVREMYQP